MKNYKDLNINILEEGRKSDNRTDTPTLAVFGRELRWNMKDGFPALTLKRAFFRGADVELNWMLRGLTNVDYLNEHNVDFWDKWALKEDVYEERLLSQLERIDLYAKQAEGSRVEVTRMFNTMTTSEANLVLAENGIPRTERILKFRKGDLGPVYGELMRRFPNGDGTTTDQIQELIDGLKANPISRRHVVSLWFPGYLPDESISPQENVLNGKQALAPCHWNFEVMVEPLTFDERWELLGERVSDVDLYRGHSNMDAVFEEHRVPVYKLNLHFHMRSNDVPAGLPVNISFYGILMHRLCHECNMDLGDLWYTGTNVHIYHDQIKMVKEMLERDPKSLPKIKCLAPEKSFFEFEPGDWVLEGYDPHPAIRVPVAI